MPPASIHQWRQADGAAIAWHYSQNLNFWEPEICNLFYTGDAHAVGELPILYWFSGLYSSFWSWPAYPLRWIGLLVLFFGCWSFGWILFRLTGRPAMAALASALLLTSPILIYYGPNFLPDAPGFCFILIMLACLFQADKQQSNGWLLTAGAFAALAVLLKLSMAITPMALAITWGLGKWNRQWRSYSLWDSWWPPWVVAGTTIIILGFRWWIAQYNAAHQMPYFLASTRPIWNYDWPFIRETIALFVKTGLPVYASAGLYLATAAGLWFTIKYWRSTAFWIKTCMVFTALGSIAYTLLWFRMLREHDYYLLCLLIIPALLLVNGLRLVSARMTGRKPHVILMILFLAGLGHSYFVSSKRFHLAYKPNGIENLPPDAFLSTRQLADAGIPDSARVLCPHDPSPNISLLALQRYGWTAYDFGDRITADTLAKYQNRFGLTHLALRDSTLYSPLYRHFFQKK